jgi:hypothetical protein
MEQPLLPIVYSTPVLQAVSRSGELKFWQCHVVSLEDSWYTQTSYWRVRKTGKMSVVRWAKPYQTRIMLAGRSDEVSAEEQAYRRVQRSYDVQVRRGRSPITEN